LVLVKLSRKPLFSTQNAPSGPPLSLQTVSLIQQECSHQLGNIAYKNEIDVDACQGRVSPTAISVLRHRDESA